uniref:N-acetyltransferase domain-containing protein n=1 Tax=Culex tarsalis TaxID=7177 RepID=A0A1Q3FA42_CULTA
MTENRLVEIIPEEWPKLCALFRRNWPEHVFAYGIVSNYLRWAQQGAETNVRIFSLNGTWPDNGTFLLFDEFEIYFYSMDVDSKYKSLSDALCLVKWEGYREVSMDFLEKHRATLDAAITTKNLFVSKDTLTNFYYKSKEEVINEDLANRQELRFDRVTDEHLDHIYNQWPLRTSISKDTGYNLLKRLILLNDSVGLFDIDSGNLLSWCLRDQTGAFSDLQTNETHLRKGYGRAVVTEFCRRLAVQGDDSYAFVLATNEKSCKLFESCGFTKITHLHWVVVRKKE